METREWHLDRDGYSCWKAECDCPGPPSRLVAWLTTRTHPGVFLLAVAVGLVLLLRGG